MNNNRFAKKLFEQLSFLETSCKLYDKGSEIEAYRIATSLRVIFHDSAHSVSLITHCKMNDWEFLTSNPTIGEKITPLRFFSVELSLDPPGLNCLPLLQNEFQKIQIPDWWDGESVFEHDDKFYSRKKIILSAANKEGGAHVDKESDKFYQTMEHELKGFNMNLSGIAYHATNSHFAMIRQFGHEVLKSADYFKWNKKLGMSKNTQVVPHWRSFKH